jgi:phosphatidylglycerophosphate synthase
MNDIFIKYYYDIAIMISNVIKNKFTPNQITSFNILLRIYILYIFKNSKYKYIWVLYLFSFILDCLDGYTARKYDQVTKLGDYMDHISDVIFHFIFTIMVLIRTKKKYIKIFIFSVIFFTLSLCTHLGCLYKYEIPKTKEKKFLSNLECLCHKKDLMNYTKYVGVGTAILIMTTLLGFHKCWLLE